MFETKENEPISARRTKDFLNSIPLSLRSFNAITGISQATLSRIINGSISFRHDNIITITKAFGITEFQFFDINFQIPNRSILIKKLRKYIKENNRDLNLDILLQGNHTTHFIDLYISRQFLNQYKNVNTIKKEIIEEFDVTLINSDITNTLNRRLGTIVEKKVSEITSLTEFRVINQQLSFFKEKTIN